MTTAGELAKSLDVSLDRVLARMVVPPELALKLQADVERERKAAAEHQRRNAMWVQWTNDVAPRRRSEYVGRAQADAVAAFVRQRRKTHRNPRLTVYGPDPDVDLAPPFMRAEVAHRAGLKAAKEWDEGLNNGQQDAFEKWLSEQP